MSEPLHNRPVPRARVSAALKRNMARRKTASRPSPVASNLATHADFSLAEAERHVQAADEGDPS